MLQHIYLAGARESAMIDESVIASRFIKRLWTGVIKRFSTCAEI
jgi:hypothetical protein